MIELPPELPWRVGRSLGRTLYVQKSGDPSKGDRFIGVMDTPELADLVIRTRMALADLVRQHGDSPYAEESPVWQEAKRVMAHWIRLPDDV